MQIAPLGGAADLVAARRARDVAHAGRQRLEDGIEPLHSLVRAADHHAVAALQAPNAAARPHVHIVNPPGREFVGAADVVHVVGIAPVDEDVPRLQMGQEVGDGPVHDGRRDHQPDRPRLFQLLYKVRERRSPNGFLLGQLLYDVGRPVEDHAVMASLEKPPHHVGPHPAKSDHSELHS